MNWFKSAIQIDKILQEWSYNDQLNLNFKRFLFRIEANTESYFERKKTNPN